MSCFMLHVSQFIVFLSVEVTADCLISWLRRKVEHTGITLHVCMLHFSGATVYIDTA